jgi:hypothetical protein
MHTWDDMHRTCGRFGVVLRLHGNGLVFEDVERGIRVKASSLGRQLSKPRLCKRLGNLFFCNEDVVVPVFVTSEQYRGNFPGGMGLVGADASCTLAATDAGLSGNWTAWLSDSTTDAINRIPDGEYWLFDGTLVADGKADLTDGMLESPIIVQETGSPIPGGSLEVWTATDEDGTRGDSETCFNWTSTDVLDTAHTGRADATDATWTDQGVAEGCDIFNRLYCFADATSN